MKKTPVIVHLDAADVVKLKELAARACVSQSEVVRHIIRDNYAFGKLLTAEMLTKLTEPKLSESEEVTENLGQIPKTTFRYKSLRSVKEQADDQTSDAMDQGES